MTISQLLLILRARYKVVLLTLLLVVSGALLISLILPKEYTAGASVVVDVKSPDPLAGMVLPGALTPGYMATQIDIINSDRVARRVVKLLRMDESPAIREQWIEATQGEGELPVWLGELLKKKTEREAFAREQCHQHRVQR